MQAQKYQVYNVDIKAQKYQVYNVDMKAQMADLNFWNIFFVSLQVVFWVFEVIHVSLKEKWFYLKINFFYSMVIYYTIDDMYLQVKLKNWADIEELP